MVPPAQPDPHSRKRQSKSKPQRAQLGNCHSVCNLVPRPMCQFLGLTVQPAEVARSLPDGVLVPVVAGRSSALAAPATPIPAMLGHRGPLLLTPVGDWSKPESLLAKLWLPRVAAVAEKCEKEAVLESDSCAEPRSIFADEKLFLMVPSAPGGVDRLKNGTVFATIRLSSS